MKIQSVRGMKDVGIDDSPLWRYIEGHAKRLFDAYGFTELRTPIVENTALFRRGVGDQTDIVEKEMYSFTDRNGESLSLRPEATASSVRAVLENSWLRANPVLKLFYIGPMFRHERPQKGRYRQFYQIGAELFGPAGPQADIEILALQHQLFTNLGLEGVELRISSIGCDRCRPPYKELLIERLSPYKDELCGDCQRRLQHNPLRILDCKVPRCQEIASTMPALVEQLCDQCDPHFEQVKEGLQSLGIPFRVDPSIVRGLDYYNRTAFEFVCKGEQLGSQATISGGGRYDKLVEQLGGPACPAVGFAAGVERLALLLEAKKMQLQAGVDVFFVAADTVAAPHLLPFCYRLREQGLRAELDLEGKSFKAQMKRADKLRSRFVMILGQNEIAKNTAILKNMTTGEQEELALDQIEAHLLALLPRRETFLFS